MLVFSGSESQTERPILRIVVLFFVTFIKTLALASSGPSRIFFFRLSQHYFFGFVDEIVGLYFAQLIFSVTYRGVTSIDFSVTF